MKSKIVLGLALIAVVAAGEKTAPRNIERLDLKAAAADPRQYPKEMVVPGQPKFDGSYKQKIQYESDDKAVTVGIWASEPGILQTDAYPYDEYCLVLEGNLVVTNRSGTKEEFKDGDTFVIPKGWAGTWDMKTKFKKQYVATSAR